MKFRHKSGGICQPKTEDAVNRLKNNPDYTLLEEKRQKPKAKEAQEQD